MAVGGTADALDDPAGLLHSLQGGELSVVCRKRQLSVGGHDDAGVLLDVGALECGRGPRVAAWGNGPRGDFCGWVQEAFSVPMCFGLGLYALCHLRTLTLRKVIVGSAYGLGALALVYVSSRRLQTVEVFSVMGLVMTLCKIAVAAKGVWLLGALALCSRATRQRLRQEGEALAYISLLMIT